MQNLKHISTNEITLYSEDEPEQVVVTQVEFELEQSHKIRGVNRKIAVFDGAYGSYCQQTILNKHQKKSDFRFDLAYLNPIPVREHHVSWLWAISAMGLGVLSAVMFLVGWFSNFGTSVYHLITFVAVVSAAVISLLLFVHNSYDKVVFLSQNGNVQLIELLNKYPDKESFRKFIGRFILRIKRAKKNKHLAPSKYLAGELKELRRLKEESVISAEIYEMAKAEIFQNESYQTTIPRILH